MERGGFGAQGQQQSEDCAFPAGSLLGVPIRVHYFLVIMFLYQVAGAYQSHGALPLWFPVAYACGCQILLFATILCHEFGHGLMARFLGGRIVQILLWPFGGICFSTRPDNVLDVKAKLKNDLKIVVAGPSTHFFQAPFWLAVTCAINVHFGVKDYPYWSMLIPFANPIVPYQLSGNLPWILAWELCSFAATTNVFLFIFNVFFPMYPMDSAQMCVCTLQLCGCTARTAAKFLIYVTVPMACLLMYNAWSSRFQGFMPALTAYMAVMCIMEAYKIRNLMVERKLHTHHLFEAARSSTAYDEEHGAYRMNNSNLDDTPVVPRNQRPPQPAANRSIALFAGDGNRLGQ